MHANAQLVLDTKVFCAFSAPGDGKQHGEEGGWEAHGTVHQARVEIHIRVQLARHKVLICQRSVLQCSTISHSISVVHK